MTADLRARLLALDGSPPNVAIAAYRMAIEDAAKACNRERLNHPRHDAMLALQSAEDAVRALAEGL